MKTQGLVASAIFEMYFIQLSPDPVTPTAALVFEEQPQGQQQGKVLVPPDGEEFRWLDGDLVLVTSQHQPAQRQGARKAQQGLTVAVLGRMPVR